MAGCSTAGSCASKSCGKLNVYDWLENMLPPSIGESRNIYEIRFKSTRKGYYINSNNLELFNGDWVVVECERGTDTGQILMGGELVRLQLKKKRIDERNLLRICRKASEDDLKKLEALREKELGMIRVAREMIAKLRIDMKLSDIEFQGDGTKCIFFYTAESRVDFRELLKMFANEFRIRVEMRQIGLRQESGLLGAIGSCGRELCCSTWLTDFKSVNTAAARYQNISLNPSKITGLCGRLKCCLNYELEAYIDALKDIPEVREIYTETGVAYLQKTDIFRKKMWYGYGGDSNWAMLDVSQVLALKEMNQRGEKPVSLTIDTPVKTTRSGQVVTQDFVDVVGQSKIHERKLTNLNEPRTPTKNRKKVKKTNQSQSHNQSEVKLNGASPQKPQVQNSDSRPSKREKGSNPNQPKPNNSNPTNKPES